MVEGLAPVAELVDQVASEPLSMLEASSVERDHTVAVVEAYIRHLYKDSPAEEAPGGEKRNQTEEVAAGW